jgi:hypothetical protein
MSGPSFTLGPINVRSSLALSTIKARRSVGSRLASSGPSSGDFSLLPIGCARGLIPGGEPAPTVVSSGVVTRCGVDRGAKGALGLAGAASSSALFGALCAAALACGSESSGPAIEPSSSPDGVGGSGAAGAGSASEPGGGEPSADLSAFATPTCAAPTGLASPSGIAQVVDWINALPKPLSLACFLETLARPLPVYASQSLFSAQPAVGRRSPRMFLFAEALIMTITPDGEGSHLLEFGERRTNSTSLKGEIRFPVTAELEPAAPYDHLIVDDRFTTCSGCHDNEEQDPSITFARAFISRALRPAPAERVGLEELHGEARACDALVEPERCAMLVAVFGQGGVVNAEFPATLDTFY